MRSITPLSDSWSDRMLAVLWTRWHCAYLLDQSASDDAKQNSRPALPSTSVLSVIVISTLSDFLSVCSCH